MFGQVVLAPATTVSTCVTDAERRQAAIDCSIGSIKGLGLGAVPYKTGKFAGIDPCTLKSYPPCPTFSTRILKALLPVTRREPLTVQQFPAQLATKPVYSTTMTARPAQATIVATPDGATVVTSPAPTAMPPEEKKMSLATMGILAALVAGGGYLAYRAYKGK